MPTGIRENVKETEYNKGFDEGYKTGRKYYINDIDLEIEAVKKALQALEDYVHENDEAVDDLQMTLKVLGIIKIKANSNRFL